MEISDLPDDLLIDILVRLLPESLGQLKSISKSWNSLISSPKFQKLSLKQSRITRKPNVLVSEIYWIQMIEFSFKGEVFQCSFKPLHSLAELLDDRSIIQIVGSSNGIICLLLSLEHEKNCLLDDDHDSCCLFDDYSFVLCNPLTKETWDLPGYEWKKLFSDESFYGFWYDDLEDDYKVVIVNDVFKEEGIHEFECEIYSLRSNSWKKVVSVLDLIYGYELPCHGADGVLVKSVLYWIILVDEPISNLILAFDLKTFKHMIVPMPSDLEGQNIDSLKLTVWNGSLVLSNGRESGDLYSLWVMKLNHSWTRIDIHKSYPQSCVTPLAFLEDNNDKRILISYDDFQEKLVLNNLVCDQNWSLGNEEPCHFHNARQVEFVASLVRPYPPPCIIGLLDEKISSEVALRNYDSFHIHVNGISIDSQIPEHVRLKYYDLCCCSNKSFLHQRFVPGIHSKLAATMIIEVVNIADSIRSCNFTTFKDEYVKWGKSLRSFELLGMNVGFLRDRIRCLLSLSLDAFKYWEVKAENDRIQGEIQDLEIELALLKQAASGTLKPVVGFLRWLPCLAFDSEKSIEAKTRRVPKAEERAHIQGEIKLAELKQASKKYDAEVDTLKHKAESFNVMFQQEANAPW